MKKENQKILKDNNINRKKKVSNMEDKNQKLPSTRIQCDTGILGKLHSNLWKYWIFNAEIFTYFNNNYIK